MAGYIGSKAVITSGVSASIDELNLIDGVTATTAELNYNDTGAAVGVVVASKTVTADANKDVASFRNITLTGELDAGSLDISGNADIDGTLETDALSIAGVTVAATAAELNILDGVTSTAAELNKLDGVGTLKQAGKETIWVPASAMQPTTSNPCSDLTTVETTSGRPDLVVLDFDKDSDEFAQFSVAFPVSWNAGTVTFQVFWAGIAATSDVDWMVDAVAISNNTTIDVAYGTAVVVTDNAQGAVEELNVSAESGAVTIAGSPGDDELCFFRIGRDVSGDGMAGDARLVGIKLFFTTDLANDG